MINKELRIITPLPSRMLSPNYNAFWGAKLKAKKSDKEFGYFYTLEALQKLDKKDRLTFTNEDTFSISLNFYYHDRRRRDLDNSEAAFKHMQDGICLALKIDDSRIKVKERSIMSYDKKNPRTEVILKII